MQYYQIRMKITSTHREKCIVLYGIKAYAVLFTKSYFPRRVKNKRQALGNHINASIKFSVQRKYEDIEFRNGFVNEF